MKTEFEVKNIIEHGAPAEIAALTNEEASLVWIGTQEALEAFLQAERDKVAADAREARYDSSPETRAAVFDASVNMRVDSLRVAQEAERILAAENYTGGRELSWDAMLDDVELRFLLDNLLAAGTTNFLVGPPNIGKTMCYVGMTLSMVSGVDFLGRKTLPGKVLFVLGEGKHGFMLRVLGWCRANGVDPDTLRDKLAFYDGGNLNNDVSLADMGNLIARFDPAVIVFDTWAATSGIADEDRSALASVTMNRAREIAPDAALLFIHHPTKSTENTAQPVMRGSGALAGTADCVMTLFEDRDYKSRDGKSRSYLALSTEREHGGKNRNAPRETIRGLYLDGVSVEYGNTRGETAVLRRDEGGSLSPADLFAIAWLTNEPQTVKELTEVSGQSVSSVQRHLNAATNVTKHKPDAVTAATYTLSKDEN